jgi:hypothetical protein
VTDEILIDLPEAFLLADIDVMAAAGAAILTAVLSLFTGKWARETSRSRKVSKDPATYLWYGNLAAMMIVFLNHSEYQLIELSAEHLLAIAAAAAVFYPLGYRYGRLNIQNYTYFTFSAHGQEAIDPLSFIYYTVIKDGKTVLCIQEESLRAVCKSLLGIHNTLEFPFGAIRRTHIRRTMKKRKIDTGCVSVKEITVKTTTRKILRFIPITTKHYKFAVGSHNTVSPQEYAVSTEVYKIAVAAAESLNVENEGLQTAVEVAEIQGGVHAVKRLRSKRIEADIVAKAKQDLEAEAKRREEEDG